MSDQVGNQNVGFFMTRLIYTLGLSAMTKLSQVLTAKTDQTTVMIPSFPTDRPLHTVQTQIRLLLEEQSDQGPHCLPIHLHLLNNFLYGKTSFLNFKIITENNLSVQKFRSFTVYMWILT